LAKLPVRKNVAGTRLAVSVASIDATPSSLAPPSKVSATTLDEVGIASQSEPDSEGGIPVGVGLGVGVGVGRGVCVGVAVGVGGADGRADVVVDGD
jgi:hypothetical protein